MGDYGIYTDMVMDAIERLKNMTDDEFMFDLYRFGYYSDDIDNILCSETGCNNMGKKMTSSKP